MKIEEAKQITGSMTRTSKMPGLDSLPAWECKTGAKLRNILRLRWLGGGRNYTLPGHQSSSIRETAENTLLGPAMCTGEAPSLFQMATLGKAKTARLFEVCRLTPDTKHYADARSAILEACGPCHSSVKFNNLGCHHTWWTRLWPWTSTVGSSSRVPFKAANVDCSCWNRDYGYVEYGKYSHRLLEILHNEWCRANGYPVAGLSVKRQATC